LWLFNGGHIDRGETTDQALRREISEEWGVPIELENIIPSILTITEIVSNPNGRPCKEHYDIWHLIPVNISGFKPEKEKLDTEFYTTKWSDIDEARALITDPCTIEALDFLETNIWQNEK
jgi:8-oxo-dGTP pyrophosphatase MutT (NUDIX family)